MIDHITIPVNDLVRSRVFYEKALAPFNYKVSFGEEGRFWAFDIGNAALFEVSQYKATGQLTPFHVAFRAKSQEQVRQFYEAALAAGGKCNGAPGPRPQYTENYYAAFIIDPSGHNIEAVFDKNEKLLLQAKIDASFLASFERSNTDYFQEPNRSIQDAYKAGIYDATVNHIGELLLKITGTSQTRDEVEKFLRQTSFNSELSLTDNEGCSIKSMDDQKKLVDSWFEKQKKENRYFQLILMIPKDNDRKKLSAIVRQFLIQNFNNLNYAYVEHTDTDIFHYHLIIEGGVNESLISTLKSSFINTCLKHEAKLL